MPPRWITARQAFDYRWPGVPAITAYPPGEHLVKNAVADFAVERGYATEGKADGSQARSSKGGPKRQRARRVKEPAAAKAADNGSDDRVDEPDMADPDRADDRGGVDQAAG